ncbi:hypothetical protein PSHT_04094 [Puccinia striiformis]|uniref:MICOS complex subunit MIC10 n=1 Tax=Puccinia striiformis TaxID=27350 RepID=A0A2S4WDT2_9BASI|nr:hypothetical protein PSHT_04094 [Puccinia striiformis]
MNLKQRLRNLDADGDQSKSLTKLTVTLSSHLSSSIASGVKPPPYLGGSASHSQGRASVGLPEPGPSHTVPPEFKQSPLDTNNRVSEAGKQDVPVRSINHNISMASQKLSTSENILSEKTDVCIANGIVKTGMGFGAGVIVSVIAFKRRAFPVWIGVGSGLGASYSDCQRTFNPAHLPGYRFLDSPPTSSNERKKFVSCFFFLRLSPSTTKECSK